MNKYQLYLIFDRISHRYSSPLPFLNEELAKRYFKSLLKNCDGQKVLPTDYELYYSGEFDDQTGIYYVDTPHFILGGSENEESEE